MTYLWGSPGSVCSWASRAFCWLAAPQRTSGWCWGNSGHQPPPPSSSVVSVHCSCSCRERRKESLWEKEDVGRRGRARMFGCQRKHFSLNRVFYGVQLLLPYFRSKIMSRYDLQYHKLASTCKSFKLNQIKPQLLDPNPAMTVFKMKLKMLNRLKLAQFRRLINSSFQTLFKTWKLFKV